MTFPFSERSSQGRQARGMGRTQLHVTTSASRDSNEDVPDSDRDVPDSDTISITAPTTRIGHVPAIRRTKDHDPARMAVEPTC